MGGIFILLVPWRDPSHIKTNIYPTYTKDKEKKTTPNYLEVVF